MTEQNLNIKSKSYHPDAWENVYLLRGYDEGLKEDFIRNLRVKISPSFPNEIEVISFDVREDFASQKVLEECCIPSLFFGYKIVYLKNFDLAKKDERDKFADYLKNPSESACLIFDAGSLSKKDKFIDLFGPNQIVECVIDSKIGMVQWAQSYFNKAGKEISTSALEAFLNSTGATVLEMKSDADKLVLYIGERKSVQQEDITLLLSGESAHDVFELTDAVSQRNLRRTLMILHHLFHQGKSSIELVGWLSWHFRRVWMTKSLLDRKISPFQISKRVHIGQRYFSDFAKNAAQISHEHLHRIFQSLLSTDCAMKSSFWDDRLLLETLSIELCA